MIDNNVNIIAKARGIAAAAHKDQVIKYTKVPYIAHCAQVAGIVQVACADNVSPSNPDELIAAAWLHDTIEDSEWGYGDLAVEVGFIAAGYVRDLTDQATEGNRAERKRAERERLAKCRDEVKLIKLADVVSNLTYADWLEDGEFRGLYIGEKIRLIKSLSDIDDSIYRELWYQANDLVQNQFSKWAD